MTNEKVEKSNKTKMVAIIGVIAIVIVALGVFIMLSPTPLIYDGDMEISHVIGENVSFSAKAGDVITIEISNFQSESGHGFSIHLYNEYGISQFWIRYDNKDATYTLEITETGDYYLKFSLSGFSLIDPKVSFHLLVKKG